MQLSDYEYVLAVSKHKNISRAAKELFISQSTLSRIISRIEDDMGIEFFDRTSSPLTITEAGERYLYYMEEMRVLEKKMFKEFEELNPAKKGQIIVGFPFTYACDFLPYVLPDFYKKFPNTKVVIKEMPSAMLEENLLNHSIDLAIIADNTFSPELVCEYLETQRILLIVPKNHPLYYDMYQTNYAVLSIDDMHKLNNEPFILLSPGEGMRVVSDHFFQKYHITPNVIMEVQDTATAYSLSVSGLGLTLVSDLRALLKMPNMIVSDYCCYQLGNPPYTRTRVVAYPKNAVLTPSEEYFIFLAKENIKNLYMHAKRF